MEELIKGPQTGLMAVIPENTRLRQLFVTSDGLAYVDLSRQVAEANFYGSSGEMAVVYSIVDSLTYNFKSIKKSVCLLRVTNGKPWADMLTSPILLSRIIL